MPENVYSTPDSPSTLLSDDPYREIARPLSRICAYVVDLFVMGAPASWIFSANLVYYDMKPGLMEILALRLGIFATGVFAQAVFEASSLQATPGKLLLGMRVYTATGEAPSFLQTFARSLCKWILLSLFLPLGLIVFLDSQRRMPWDFLMGTVVRAKPSRKARKADTNTG